MEIDKNCSYFASRDTGYGKELISLSLQDRLQHLYVVGKTGMGKSTLLKNIIYQDIIHGRGVGVIDPHGSLALDLLDCIPPWRWDDLIYFDPSGERKYPIGLNPLKIVPEDDRHLIAANVVAVFSAIWKFTPERTPRLPRVLYNCIRALLDLPASEGATLLGISRLLDDTDYRRRVLSFVRDSQCRDFWTNEVPKGSRELSEMIGPVQTRVGAFLQSPDLRRIFGQVKRKVEPREIMDNRKIFIANLRKGRLGSEAANLIGSFIVTDFESAAYSREDVLEAGDAPEPFYLFIDEFQNFTTDSFASALSEVRKYGLSLSLGSQFRAQMSEEVKSALTGNIGSVIAFRLGEEDAPDMAKQFAPFTESTLLELSKYEICVKMLRRGETVQPFLAATLEPLEVSCGSREMVVARSRRHYARPREEVEAKIKRWLAPRTPHNRVPRRRKPEEIVEALRQADKQISLGKSWFQVAQKMGVSEETFARWRKEYGGLTENEAGRLKDLRTENSKLRKAVTNLAVEKVMFDEPKEGIGREED